MRLPIPPQDNILAGKTGLEPVTVPLTGVRSTYLSYNPKIKNPVSLKGLTGFSLKIHLVMKQN